MRKYLAQLSVAIACGLLLASPALMHESAATSPSDGLDLTALLAPERSVVKRPVARPKPSQKRQFGSSEPLRSH